MSNTVNKIISYLTPCSAWLSYDFNLDPADEKEVIEEAISEFDGHIVPLPQIWWKNTYKFQGGKEPFRVIGYTFVKRNVNHLVIFYPKDGRLVARHGSMFSILERLQPLYNVSKKESPPVMTLADLNHAAVWEPTGNVKEVVERRDIRDRVFYLVKSSKSVEPVSAQITNKLWRLKSGNASFRIVAASYEAFYIYYTSSRHLIEQPIHRLKDLVPYNKQSSMFGEYELNETPSIEEENMMANAKNETLYEITTQGDEKTKVFGYLLSPNREGKWVMEVKGSNDVIVIDKSQAVEVMPYTVSVVYLDRASKTVYHFYAVEGDWAEGDMLYSTDYDQLMQVKKLDTRSRQASMWLEGYKLAGTFVKAGSHD